MECLVHVKVCIMNVQCVDVLLQYAGQCSAYLEVMPGILIPDPFSRSCMRNFAISASPKGRLWKTYRDVVRAERAGKAEVVAERGRDCHE